jgi:hypothetical protein
MQKMSSGIAGKETVIKAIMQLKQKLQMLNDLRLKKDLKLADKDALNKGYIDVYGKILALEKDIVDGLAPPTR